MPTNNVKQENDKRQLGLVYNFLYTPTITEHEHLMIFYKQAFEPLQQVDTKFPTNSCQRLSKCQTEQSVAQFTSSWKEDSLFLKYCARPYPNNLMKTIK